MAAKPVAVITGPTSGIGRWIALGLARAGYRLVLVARDRTRVEATRTWLAEQVNELDARIVLADLSLLEQARGAAREVAVRFPEVALLVNNAGLITRRRQVTAEGHERILAVNHLTPFVLTRGLEAALRAGGGGRVVNVGSNASDDANIALDDLELEQNWRPMRAYGQSKLALLMAGMEWARRFDGSGVSVNTVHPGLVATNIGHLGGLASLAWRVMSLFALSPEKGAEAPLHAALTPELAGVTGRYFHRQKETTPNKLAQDSALRARLWDTTARLIG